MTVVAGKSDGTITVTPSGIPVYFQSREKNAKGEWKDKRLYRIGMDGPQWPLDDDEALLASAQAEDEFWAEVVSVTTALDCLNKGGLSWWGMGIGASGVTMLTNLGFVKEHKLPGTDHSVLICPKIWEVEQDGKKKQLFDPDTWVVAGEEQLILWLKHQKLTVNHSLRKAGDRGQAVHDALEHWANTGELPDVSIYPPTQAGYVRGLLAFLQDVPSAKPIASEVIVASREHKYAGRYDLRFETTEPHEVVVHRTPVKGPQYRTLLPGETLTDLKTSKGIYPSHSRQLAGLEKASVESGYEPTKHQGILHVSAEGEYEFKRSWATFEDFRVVLDVWHSDRRMEEAERADRKRK